MRTSTLSRKWFPSMAVAAVVAVAGAALLSASCRPQSGVSGQTGSPKESGSLRARLVSNELPDLLTSVRLDVTEGTTIVDSVTLTLSPLLVLPGGQQARGADGLFILAPNTYGISATALDGNGAPVATCATASTSASVSVGQTTEIVLGILCTDGGTGGIDVIVTVGSPPVITGLQLEPGKFLGTDERLFAKVSAVSSSHSIPLSYQWSVVNAPEPRFIELNPFGDTANLIIRKAGDYTVSVRVTDTGGRTTVLTFPLHVADLPRPNPPPGSDVHADEPPCRGGEESLQAFSARCDKAMGGVGVPAFDCEDLDSTEPPRQSDGAGVCSAPNVLNSACDPGSHFHMLHRNAGGDGIYIAAHCRHKEVDGNGPGQFGDVAVIQYNSKTGATCFYQALKTGLPKSAPAPISGDTSFWLTPGGTAGITCVRCHDTGPLIRSPYLAQLGEVWPFWGDQNNPNNPARPNLPSADKNYLPGTLQTELAGPWNASMKYGFVGLSFQSWEAHFLNNTGDPTCSGCHRMGISRAGGVWNPGGTSRDLGIRATNSSQAASKLPHGKIDPGKTSPIWMMPGSITYSASTAGHASAMKSCADSIVNGSPISGCSATRFARGNTCPPPSITVNGGISADDPTTWKTSGKMPLGQPGGRIGFYFFTAIHGPFYQNSPWDPYVDVPPAVATPPDWDPPSFAPSFRGTYLRIYGEPPGQWTVAWGLDATDIQNTNNNPPPPGGPGGVIDGLAFDQIDTVPDPNNCGSGYFSVSDPSGTNSPLSTTINSPAGASVAILAGFIGNVSRGTLSASGAVAPAFLRVTDSGGATRLLQSHDNNPIPPVSMRLTGESWANGCAGWQASMHYAAHNVVSTGDVVLVSAAQAPDVRCYIEGIAGDWSRWRSNGNGGSFQPYAQIYFNQGTGYHLKVWPDSGSDAVSAYASCIFLK